VVTLNYYTRKVVSAAIIISIMTIISFRYGERERESDMEKGNNTKNNTL